MPGPPATLFTPVVINPGATGVPDTGFISQVLPPFITANGIPLATSGSICTMLNSLTGVPYLLVIGPLASSGVTVGGRALVRVGDRIPTPPGILIVGGPSAALFINDQWPP